MQYFVLYEMRMNNVVSDFLMNLLADTGGRVDMKRIFGIIAVEGKVRPEKGVKVLSLSLSLSLSFFFFSFFQWVNDEKDRLNDGDSWLDLG